MQLGLDVGATTVRLAVVDGGELIRTAEITAGRDLRETLAAVRAELSGAHRLQEVRLAVVPTLAELDLSGVGHVRIAPATMPALRPFAAWPSELRAGLANRLVEVSGGSDYVGSNIVRASASDLTAARAHLERAGATHLVVSAAGAPSAPLLEREAAAVLAPDADFPVTLAHTVGGTGLREREHAAVLNAGLVGWAERVVSDTRAVFPDARLGFAHGLGGYGSAEELIRHPLGALHGRIAAAALGAMALTRSADFLLGVGESGGVRLVGVTGGVLDRADVEALWGTTHNSLALDLDEIRCSSRAELAVSPEIARMLARRPGYPVVVAGQIGEAASAQGESTRADGGIVSMPFALAYGSVLGRVTVALERVVPRPPGAPAAAASQAEGLVEEATTRAILAGADPARIQAAVIDVRALAYVAEAVDTVRVRVSREPQ